MSFNSVISNKFSWDQIKDNLPDKENNSRKYDEIGGDGEWMVRNKQWELLRYKHINRGEEIKWEFDREGWYVMDSNKYISGVSMMIALCPDIELIKSIIQSLTSDPMRYKIDVNYLQGFGKMLEIHSSIGTDTTKIIPLFIEKCLFLLDESCVKPNGKPPHYSMKLDGVTVGFLLSHLSGNEQDIREIELYNRLMMLNESKLKRHQPRDALKFTISRCNYPMFLKLVPYYGGHFNTQEWSDMASQSSLNILKYVVEVMKLKLTNYSVDRAVEGYLAESDKLQVIKYLYDYHQSLPSEERMRIYPISNSAIDFACELGEFEIVKYLNEKFNTPCTKNTMDIAAAYGHLNIVKYLHENRTEGCTTNAMDLSGKYGHLEVFKFLHKNRTEGCSTNTITNNFSARFGKLDMIKYLTENPELCSGTNTDVMDNACQYGQLEVLKYLHQNRTQVNIKYILI
eukprot:gene4603-5749_t